MPSSRVSHDFFCNNLLYFILQYGDYLPTYTRFYYKKKTILTIFSQGGSFENNLELCGNTWSPLREILKTLQIYFGIQVSVFDEFVGQFISAAVSMRLL